MSTFTVTVAELSKVYPHPNAEKLELAQVDGMTYQFCVTKDKYKVGEKVVYFPIDSILPEELITFFGIKNFLAGKDKNRLKTVRLRDQISQGFICHLSDLADFIDQDSPIGKDVKDILHFTKYEAPEVLSNTGNLVRHPDGVSTFDIEGGDRFPVAVERLRVQIVAVAEKMEGTNHYTTITEDGKILVGQKNYQIQQLEGKQNTYWKAALDNNHPEILKFLKELYPQAKQITIRSEMCGPGIQKNIYGFTHTKLFAFAILIDDVYVNQNDLEALFIKLSLNYAPYISKDKTLGELLEGKTLQEYSHGESLFDTTKSCAKGFREGIVITPMTEQYEPSIPGGRLIIKQRDPVYLDITGF